MKYKFVYPHFRKSREHSDGFVDGRHATLDMEDVCFVYVFLNVFHKSQHVSQVYIGFLPTVYLRFLFCGKCALNLHPTPPKFNMSPKKGPVQEEHSFPILLFVEGLEGLFVSIHAGLEIHFFLHLNELILD